jgi:RNA polymerase sigma factor (sigma-70 family)
VHLSRLLRLGQAAETVRRGLGDAASDTEWAFSCGLPSAAALHAVLSAAQSARSLLLLRNMGLVKSAARRFNASLGIVRAEDLVSDGLAGLSNALEAYDPERGYRLSTFAFTRVEAAQRRAIQNGRAALRVPVWVQEVNTKLQKARAALAAIGELQPTDAQLAEAASTPLTHVRAAATAFSRREASFDEELLQASKTSDEAQIWADEVKVDAKPAAEQKDPDHNAEPDPFVKASVEMLEQTLRSQVQRNALRAIYGLDGSAPQTQNAVAKRFGLTRHVVAALVKKALTQLSTAV